MSKVGKSKMDRVSNRKANPIVYGRGQKAGRYSGETGFEGRSGTGSVENKQAVRKQMME